MTKTYPFSCVKNLEKIEKYYHSLKSLAKDVNLSDRERHIFQIKFRNVQAVYCDILSHTQGGGVAWIDGETFGKVKRILKECENK